MQRPRYAGKRAWKLVAGGKETFPRLSLVPLVANLQVADNPLGTLPVTSANSPLSGNFTASVQLVSGPSTQNQQMPGDRPVLIVSDGRRISLASSAGLFAQRPPISDLA
jgi:hypothetical protein